MFTARSLPLNRPNVQIRHGQAIRPSSRYYEGLGEGFGDRIQRPQCRSVPQYYSVDLDRCQSDRGSCKVSRPTVHSQV